MSDMGVALDVVDNSSHSTCLSVRLSYKHVYIVHMMQKSKIATRNISPALKNEIYTANGVSIRRIEMLFAEVLLETIYRWQKLKAGISNKAPGIKYRKTLIVGLHTQCVQCLCYMVQTLML
ncbi:hypothetical protein DPMN_026227 [Dreissena polymorpha]|uniref:Uncharacterized protein n=1 Tax=Dreissena polymorpha TaxID=45954 RepID=A0A9D4LT13_DREPO|nr:hypothetical protein DPMN_026227 [Dreissena polymorpha]